MPDREHAGEPAIIIIVPAVIKLAAGHAANIKKYGMPDFLHNIQKAIEPNM